LHLQEIARPDIFWYDAPTKIDLPFNIVGLLAFEFFAMHFVELKRWQDFRNPGSVDADPLFPNNKLAPHEVSPWVGGSVGAVGLGRSAAIVLVVERPSGKNSSNVFQATRCSFQLASLLAPH
jgi:light-harvesting complex I chlorophyll a/b binding protein 4